MNDTGHFNLSAFTPPDGAEPPPDLPLVVIVPGKLHEATAQVLEHLCQSGAPIYKRGPVMVEPVILEKRVRLAGKVFLNECPILKPIGEYRLRVLLQRHVCRFCKPAGKKGGVAQMMDAPIDILRSALAEPNPCIPEVAGLVTAPTLRPDGSVLDVPGFDEATRLLYWPDSKLAVPEIPEAPSKADAESALEILEGLLAEFPFVTPLDKSIALSMFLSAVARGAYECCPVYLVRAPVSGTGKSYLIKLLCIFFMGHKTPVVGVPEDEAEMRKTLSALAIKSPPLIALDNLDRNLRSAFLCEMISETEVQPRLLGVSEMRECEWRGIVAATGNNVQLEGDLIRRGLTITLNAETEQPATRHFKGNPEEELLANRGKYVAAALTVVLAYLAAGRPARGVAGELNGFNEWRTYGQEPLIWLGREDPLRAIEIERKQEPHFKALEVFIEHWRRTLSQEQTHLARELHDSLPSEVAGVIRDVVGQPRLDPQILGNWLEKNKDRVCNGYSIVVKRESGKSNHYWLKAHEGAAEYNPETEPM